MQDLIGRTLGHYRVIEKIGAGGMGEVYRATDQRLDRDVAIKVLPEEVAEDSDRLRRFEREAKAVASLSHPNILEIFDFATDGDVTYAVTELLEGDTLRQELRETGGPLPWGQVQEIGSAVANGLGAAHTKGVVHRDIKPANIFLCSDGRVKILDFGLAATHEVLDSEAETGSIEAPLTREGSVMGTVGYMAPEQVRGELADHRSDIFALGCVLYEILTGERAFKRETTVEIMTAILREEPRSFAESGVQVSPEVAKAVQHCLEKNPERRFQSAADIAFALGSDSDGTESPVVPSEISRPRTWAMPLLAIAGILVVALAMVFGPGILERLGGKTEMVPIRSIAVLPFENLSGDPNQDYFADGMTEALITDLANVGGFDRVISRTSAMKLMGTDKTMPEIAKILGVEAVAEGSVQRSDERVRVTVQLIHAPTDRHLWAKSYDRTFEDILALQSEVARSITRGLTVALTATEDRRLANTRRVDEKAVDAYLKARYSAELKDSERIALLEHSIEIDSTYAPAYVQLANLLDWQFALYTPEPEDIRRVREILLKAIELDPDSADAHAQMGRHLYMVEWEWSGAETELEKALKLSPNNFSAHWGYASLMAYLGRFDEAIATAERAVVLDPLSVGPRNRLGWTNVLARRFDDAIDAYLDAIELFPKSITFRRALADYYSIKGRHVEALDTLEEAERLSSEPERSLIDWAYRARICGRAGESDCAEAALQQVLDLREQQRVSPVILAFCYLANGDNDRALDWLERAYDERDSQLIHINVNEVVDPIRDDPRFQAIIKKMNFPEH